MRATLRDIYRFVQNGGGRYWIDLAIIAVLFGVALFQALGMLPLIDPDEGRYAEVPREMLELRDFIRSEVIFVFYLC
jgi:4-amino-4-deoxy-L-arabinose transferase-like glycosyltransferase